MAFDVGKVGSAVWPEAGCVALFILAKLGTRYIDETYALTGAFRRTSDYVEAAAIGIPGYLIATGSKATGEAKAVLYTEIGFLGQRLGDAGYGRVLGPKAAVAAKNRRLAAGGNPQLSAEERRLLDQVRAERQTTQNPAALARTGVYTEF